MAKRKPMTAAEKRTRAHARANGGCGPVPKAVKPLVVSTPAFPFAVRREDLRTGEGMSLRDYFAAQALIGILGARQGFLVDVGTDNAAEWAYQTADKMLEARKQ